MTSSWRQRFIIWRWFVVAPTLMYWFQHLLRWVVEWRPNDHCEDCEAQEPATYRGGDRDKKLDHFEDDHV